MQSASSRQSHIPSLRDLPPGLRLSGIPLVTLANLTLGGLALYQTPPGHNAAVHQAAALAIHRGEHLYLDIFYPFGPGAALATLPFVHIFGNAGGLLWLLDLVFALSSSLLLYLIAIRFTGSSLAGLAAGLLYPVIHYGALAGLPGQAEVPATVFVLAAVSALFIRRVSLTLRVVLLGVCFGLSILVLPSGLPLGVPLALLVTRAAPDAKKLPAQLLYFMGMLASLAVSLAWLEGREGFSAFWYQWNAGHTLPAPDADTWVAGVGFFRTTLLAGVGLLIFSGIYGITRGRYGPIGYLVWTWLAASVAAVLLSTPGVMASWLPVFAPLVLIASAGLETLLRRSRKQAWKLTGQAAALLIMIMAVASVAATRVETSQRREAFARIQPVIEMVRTVSPSGSVLVWDWAPQIFAKSDRRPAEGMLSLQYLQLLFPTDEAISESRVELESDFPEMILVRRSIPGEGATRNDGMAPKVPALDPVLEGFLLDHYWLLKKEAGYEVFILASSVE